MRRIVILLALSASLAHADTKDDNIAKADRLFSEGKALIDTDLEGGCHKFEESLQFNSQAIGTLLNVALCDEKLGHVASAVARFTEALERAKEGGMIEHERAAEEHIRDLTPKVPHLSIKLAEPLAETTIVIDDKLVQSSAVDDLAIDPGDHTIEVGAPGRLPYQTKLHIAVAERQNVAIPALARSVTVKSSRRTIGKLFVAGGVVTLGTGAVIGFLAHRSYDAQVAPGNGHCIQDAGKAPRCDAEGYSELTSAITRGNVGTVVFVVGLAAVGVGTYLWLGAPRDSAERRVSLVPQVGPEGAGVAAVGHF